jgi:hypothetical protein
VPEGGLPYGRSLRLDALPGVDLSEDALRAYLIAAGPADVGTSACEDLVATVRPEPEAEAGAADAAREAGRDAGRHDAAPADAAPRDASGPVEGGRLDGSLVDAAHPDSTVPVDGAPGEAAPGSSPDVLLLEAGPDGGAEAGPVPVPAVRVVRLPTVPRGALGTPASYLLALGGCIGGPGVTDPSERSVCGELYAPDRPTLWPYLVRLSQRTREGRVGLQFLAAAPAVAQADLALLPVAGDPILLAEAVPVGGLRPLQADLGAAPSDLQSESPDSRVQVYVSGAEEPAYEEPWGVTLRAAGVPRLEAGKTYTLVQVGPFPGFARRSFWNDPLVTIVEN